MENKKGPSVEKSRIMISDSERDKQELAQRDLGSIQQNHESVHKVLQIHLTQTLLDLSNLQNDIEAELDSYWVKELPLNKYVTEYLRYITKLINLYTQSEDLFKKTFAEVLETIQYPDFDKLEQAYLEEIDSLNQQIEKMTESFDTYQKDMAERVAQEKDALRKETRSLLHKEYTLAFDEMESENKNLNETLLSLKDFCKKKGLDLGQWIYPSKKGTDVGETIYNAQKSRPSAGIEVFEPEPAENQAKKVKKIK